MQSKEEIEDNYKKLRTTYSILYENATAESSARLSALKHKLMQLREISGTIDRLKGKVVLDDIDLFEIKYLSLLNSAVKEDISMLLPNIVSLPNLETVVDILDPQGVRADSFYVYDNYSKELSDIRGELKAIKFSLNPLKETSDRELELLTNEKLLESKIREELSDKNNQMKLIEKMLNEVANAQAELK